MAAPDVRAYALEAARGFLLGEVLGVAVLDHLEGLHAVGERQHRHAHLRLLGLVRHDVDELGHALFLGDVLRDTGHVVAGQVAIDGLRRELALRDALDDGPRAHLRGTTGEDTGALGHQRAVRDDRLALAPANAGIALYPVEYRDLADRRDDGVALDRVVRPLDGHGATPARRIRLAERHALEFETADAAVLLDDLHGRGVEVELDALVLGVVDLAVVRAHLFARAPVDNADLGAETSRRARAVEGREPAADDDDAIALPHRNGIAFGVLAEVVDRLDHARQVLARDTQRVTAPRADAEEHRVVPLREELIHGEVAAELHAALELRVALLPERVQLFVELHLREAVLRNAVAADAALLVHHVEHRHRVTVERRVVRGGHAGRSGAHDRDALAARDLLRERRRGDVHLHHELAGVAVALADRDLLLDQPAAAHLLARLGTDESEHVGERQHLLHEARRFDVLALRHQLEVARDVDVGRAADLARRHAVRVVVAEDVLEVLLAELEQRVGARHDLHAGLDRNMARGQRTVLAFDVDQTHAARGSGRQLFVVAERRDVEAGALRGAQDRLARDRGDLLTVDGDRAGRLARRDLAGVRDRGELGFSGLDVSLEEAHAVRTILSAPSDAGSYSGRCQTRSPSRSQIASG